MTVPLAPVTITLLGEPCAWSHRTSPGGHHRYLPKKQRDIGAALRLSAQEAMFIGGNYGVMRPFFTVPVRLDLIAEFGIPKSKAKHFRIAALARVLLPGKRPDLSNILKMAEDCLSGIVYRDDALVCQLHCEKLYSEQPKIVVTVTPIEYAYTIEDNAGVTGNGKC